MIDPKTEGRIQRLLDQSEIFDLVRIERFYRDQRDWKGLIGSYIKNAPVRTTWFDGTIEGFCRGVAPQDGGARQHRQALDLSDHAQDRGQARDGREPGDDL
jgi:hypothetical protein